MGRRRRRSPISYSGGEKVQLRFFSITDWVSTNFWELGDRWLFAQPLKYYNALALFSRLSGGKIDRNCCYFIFPPRFFSEFWVVWEPIDHWERNGQPSIIMIMSARPRLRRSIGRTKRKRDNLLGFECFRLTLFEKCWMARDGWAWLPVVERFQWSFSGLSEPQTKIRGKRCKHADFFSLSNLLSFRPWKTTFTYQTLLGPTNLTEGIFCEYPKQHAIISRHLIHVLQTLLGTIHEQARKSTHSNQQNQKFGILIECLSDEQPSLSSTLFLGSLIFWLIRVAHYACTKSHI